MAKAKMYPVIIDREVAVELKDQPAIIYPAGWRGAVNKATLKVIKDMEAGREIDGSSGAAAGQPDAATEAEIKAKHDAADAEIAKKLAAAEEAAAKMIADAEARVKEIEASAAPADGKAGA